MTFPAIRTRRRYAATFLERAAYVHPEHISIIHGTQRFVWRETDARCRRLASALARRGIGKNDTVAVMAPNIPATYEAHFGVPMCGAVLNTLNTRLDAETIAFMLRHGGARALITDREFSTDDRTRSGVAGRAAFGNRHRRSGLSGRQEGR